MTRAYHTLLVSSFSGSYNSSFDKSWEKNDSIKLSSLEGGVDEVVLLDPSGKDFHTDSSTCESISSEISSSLSLLDFVVFSDEADKFLSVSFEALIRVSLEQGSICGLLSTVSHSLSASNIEQTSQINTHYHKNNIPSNSWSMCC